MDERRVHAVAPKFEGRIRCLHVNATGQAVRRGQILLDVFAAPMAGGMVSSTLLTLIVIPAV
jgi:hypothetical protein